MQVRTADRGLLDLDQHVQDHRPAGVHIDVIGVDSRVLAIVRAPAIDLHLTDIGRAVRPGPGLSGAYASMTSGGLGTSAFV